VHGGPALALEDWRARNQRDRRPTTPPRSWPGRVLAVTWRRL
jgi:hypothetical protein